MKINFFYLLVLFLASACVPKEEVVLRSIKNEKLETNEDGDQILKADAIFYNPNNVRMKLKAINVEVFVNGKKSAHSDQKFNSVIKAKSEFTVPLEVKLSLKELGLLDTILAFLGGKKYEIQFKGHLRIKVNGLTFKVPVDHKEEVRLR
ncbi:MAG: LEA type 2 family protein [Bacteroidia bacterium]|nr:LEA type 2 family protein [Bacteroidia bacterium]